MSYFIIKYATLVAGIEKTLYHKDIVKPKSKQVMNVYAESLTRYVLKAKKFHDKEEAYKVCIFFSRPHHKCKIIEL